MSDAINTSYQPHAAKESGCWCTYACSRIWDSFIIVLFFELLTVAILCVVGEIPVLHAVNLTKYNVQCNF